MCPKCPPCGPEVSPTSQAVDVDDGQRTTIGHYIQGHGLTWDHIHHLSNLIHYKFGRKEGKDKANLDGTNTMVGVKPMARQVVAHISQSLGVLRARLFEELEDGPIAEGGCNAPIVAQYVELGGADFVCMDYLMQKGDHPLGITPPRCAGHPQGCVPHASAGPCE